MSGSNKFEELLGTISDLQDEDRRVILDVAGKYPKLRDGWLRQDEFSRQMDGLKKDRTEIEARKNELAEYPKLREYQQRMDEWWKNSWVEDAYGPGRGATKTELEKDKTIEELLKKVETNDVTFEDLGKEVSRLIEGKKFVGQDDFTKALAEKESGVREYLDRNITGLSHLVVKGPTIALKHFREFNEELDMEELVKYANENKFNDISKAHDVMVSAKREEIKNKQIEERIKSEVEKARTEALKEAGVTAGRPPVDSSGPVMTDFQRFLSHSRDENGKTSVVPEGVQLGRGDIGRIAASHANYDTRAAEASA